MQFQQNASLLVPWLLPLFDYPTGDGVKVAGLAARLGRAADKTFSCTLLKEEKCVATDYAKIGFGRTGRHNGGWLARSFCVVLAKFLFEFAGVDGSHRHISVFMTHAE